MKELSTVLRPIEAIEAEILTHKRTIGASILYIGRALIEAKEQLPHGAWREWLETKVEFSVSSADNYMRIAREFTEGSSLLSLPYSKILALLPIPKEERESFALANDIENKSVSQIKALAQAAKNAEKKQTRAEEKARELAQILERERIRAETAERRLGQMHKDLLAERDRKPEVIEKRVEVESADFQRMKERAQKAEAELRASQERILRLEEQNEELEQERDNALDEIEAERECSMQDPLGVTAFCDTCATLLNRLFAAPMAEAMYRTNTDIELERRAENARMVMDWAYKTLDTIERIQEERGQIERVITLIR